jgi:hypothetical protein
MGSHIRVIVFFAVLISYSFQVQCNQLEGLKICMVKKKSKDQNTESYMITLEDMTNSKKYKDMINQNYLYFQYKAHHDHIIIQNDIDTLKPTGYIFENDVDGILPYYKQILIYPKAKKEDKLVSKKMIINILDKTIEFTIN